MRNVSCWNVCICRTRYFYSWFLSHFFLFVFCGKNYLSCPNHRTTPFTAYCGGLFLCSFSTILMCLLCNMYPGSIIRDIIILRMVTPALVCMSHVYQQWATTQEKLRTQFITVRCPLGKTVSKERMLKWGGPVLHKLSNLQSSSTIDTTALTKQKGHSTCYYLLTPQCITLTLTDVH